jgi:hypothetical protein
MGTDDSGVLYPELLRGFDNEEILNAEPHLYKTSASRATPNQATSEADRDRRNSRRKGTAQPGVLQTRPIDVLAVLGVEPVTTMGSTMT